MATLEQRIAAGFDRLTTEIKNLRPRFLLSGGIAGQVLTKNSGADYDVSWKSPAAGGGGGLTPEQVDDIARTAVIRYGVK